MYVSITVGARGFDPDIEITPNRNDPDLHQITVGKADIACDRAALVALRNHLDVYLATERRRAQAVAS